MTDFEAKCISRARKEHVCFGCRGKIAAGTPYVAYPCSASDGKLHTIKICPTCGFLIMQKDREMARNLREGEFSEQFIPNCLRKKRNAYLRDPQQALNDAGIGRPDKDETPRQISRIVVKKENFNKAIFFLPKKKLTTKSFSKGNVLTIQAGVSGEARDAIINGAWIVNGSLIGRKGKFMAVLTRIER